MTATFASTGPAWAAAIGIAALLTLTLVCYACPLAIRWAQARRWRRRGAGMLALTYDDGPDPITTPAVLDALGEFGARGTFYLVGFRAESAPGVIDRIAAEGHELATHTHTHRNAWKVGPLQEFRDSGRAYRTLAPWIGPRAAYRPPFGKISLPTWLRMRLRGRRVDWWTVAALDTRDAFPPPERLAADILADGGPVVLMHCHHAEPHRRAFVLALTRVFPNAVRLGTRSDDAGRQSALARSICIDHFFCFAAMLGFLALRLSAA